MEPFVLLASFPSFIAFFASKMAISGLKCSVERPILEVNKDKWGVWLPKPQNSRMPKKERESNKITLGLLTGIGCKFAKNDYKTGKKTPKGQMVPFSSICLTPSKKKETAPNVLRVEQF